MNRYLVTGPRPVLDHAPGDTVEADLTADQEAAHLTAGRLRIVPRNYQVVGPLPVNDTDPGGTFEAALTVNAERALIEAGHIERTTTPKKKPATSGGKAD